MRRYVPRLLPYVRPYWRLLVWSSVLMAIASFIGLLSPWPLKILVDNVIGSAPLPQFINTVVSGASHEKSLLLILTVVVAFTLTVLGSALNVVSSAVDTKLEQQVIVDFRSDLFRHTEQ